MISLQQVILFDSISLRVELSKLVAVLSNHPAALSTEFMQYFKSYVVVSTIFTASSPGIDSIARNHFLCSSIRSSLLSVKVLSWDYSNSVTSLDSTSNSNVPAISTPSSVTSSIEILNPSESAIRTGINFFETPVSLDILISSQE